MPATPRNRIRVFALLVILLAISAGLFARYQRTGADISTLIGFLAAYTGDTLWPIMFFFVGRFLFPTVSMWTIVASVLTLTLTIEFGQLWQPPWLQSARAWPIIGFVLGNTFLWSDVACLLVGVAIAVVADVVFRLINK